MYISNIRLKNIRCIDNLEIDLRSSASTNSALLLLGNNAVGKSTLLKSIALGLCDRGGASGLLADMYGNLVKNGHREGRIEIVLNSGRKEYTTATTVKRSATGAEQLNKVTEKTFPWKQVFVCGYGPSRVMQGTNTYDQYTPTDAVYSLFNYGWQLQNPELIVRRQGWNKPDVERLLLQRLAKVLMIERDEVTLSRTGLTLHNRSGGSNSIGALADGHRSTLNWILDLIGWTYLSRREEPKGIVLIDEIENHLHPRWQRHILQLLAENFQRVQFIATSHSALPAAGVYEKKGRGRRIGKAHVLRMDQSGQVTNEELPPIDGWTYDRILESHAFETPSRPVSLEDAMKAVEAAYSGPTSKITQEYRRAIRHLRNVSSSDAVAMEERRIAAELEAELTLFVEKRRKRDDSTH